MQTVYDPDAILTQEHTDAEIRNYTGSFCGFVLLDTHDYNLHALAERLAQQWDLTAVPSCSDDAAMLDLMLDVPGALVTVSFLDLPIPKEEIEMAAEHSVWQGAKEAAVSHTAHLMVAVLPDTMSAMDAGMLYCKVLSSALQHDYALAVYSSGTILEPVKFQQNTAQIEDGCLPFENLIYVGTYMRNDKSCGYTVGMDAFGKDELELLDCIEPLENVAHILRDCAYMILTEDKTTQWYSTFALDGCVWEGRRKDGVMVEGHSMQLQKIKTEL